MVGRFAITFFSGLLILTNARAEPVSVTSFEDTAEPGFFTLNFGPAGGLASGRITTTDYELEIDPEAGTSRLVRYYQEVQPLILPGGFSTGNIVVEVVEGSSVGTYDEQVRGFTTSELYAIHFRGDLSDFKLESPVVLPSTSTGTVVLNGVDGGRIDLQWEGEGELFNPFDPDNPLLFSYTCVVNTVFAARPDLLVRLGVIADVRMLDLPYDLEKSLVRELDKAARRIDQGRDSAAIRNLLAFSSIVTDQAGLNIPKTEAQALIDGARATIALLRQGIDPNPGRAREGTGTSHAG